MKTETMESMPRELEANRSFLEQWEEQAVSSDQALEWLTKEIYQDPAALSVLNNIAGREDTP